MRFKDLDDFAAKHPTLAALVEEGGHDFLDSMKEAIVGRKDITAKMMRAMKKWSDRVDLATKGAELMPKKGFMVRDAEVKVVKVYRDAGEGVLVFEFIHPDGWRGRLKDVSDHAVVHRATEMGWSITASTPSGGMPFGLIVVRAIVLWAKKEAAFAILGSRGKAMVVALPGGVSCVADAVEDATEDSGEAIEAIEEAEAWMKDFSTAKADAAKAAAGHDWERNDTHETWECRVCRGVIRSEDVVAGLGADSMEKLFGGVCKPGPAPPPLPQSSDPEGERASLLPSFGDWKSKLTL